MNRVGENKKCFNDNIPKIQFKNSQKNEIKILWVTWKSKCAVSFSFGRIYSFSALIYVFVKKKYKCVCLVALMSSQLISYSSVKLMIEIIIFFTKQEKEMWYFLIGYK